MATRKTTGTTSTKANKSVDTKKKGGKTLSVKSKKAAANPEAEGSGGNLMVPWTSWRAIADDSLPLNIRIAFHIHDVSRMRRSAYDQIMKPVGITRAQWWVMAHLSRSDGMMQTQLADVLNVGKAAVGPLLERLEAANLVERRSDAIDKRVKRVYMLKAGRQIMKTLVQEEAKFNDRVLAFMSLSEREELLRVLAGIKKALAEFGGTTSPEDADSI
ncbi:MAG: transcriptional regulator, MarR family [Hydrocarboniphaga sp.]|uniref:MarR family winged helix-turn-helix transcriptional regulator n=1 Tax=Hydrocarboniphaga sp. TaxID=2033016 RepID=UPI0026198283|nr:MarR family transcriptional regulator [Hydrocarboniphaga sp.]MDB5968426.1 transcriptional regulator, MarR family [Hydrocarboniphaga sp.]